jgi:hypothetical protein
MQGAMAHDHERATGPWQAEPLAIGQAFVLAHGAVLHARAIAEGMVVDTARMRANLDLTGGLIVAEAVMMGLAPVLGREAAHHVVKDGCDLALAERIPLAAALGAPVPRLVHVPTDLLLALDRPRFVALEEIFRFHGVYSSAKLQRDVPEYRSATPYAEGVRQTVAWMDRHGKVVSADTDPFEDQLVERWERFTQETAQALAPQQN